MSSAVHDIQKEVRKYMAVFGGLLILTVATVIARDFRTGITMGIIVALMIAVIKGSLVVCNFMHLTTERKLIYVVLLLTVFFLAAMMFLICMAHFSVPEGLRYVS